MPEIQMPPQYVGTYSDPHDAEGHVRRAIEAKAADRVNLWVSFVHSAIADFESAANLHIEELEYDHDATFSFDPIVGSFVSVIMSSFPPTATATSVLTTVMGGIQASYAQSLESGLSGAKLRLRKSMIALVKVARARTNAAGASIHEALPTAIEDAMTWVDSASTDPDYVSAFCDWMGFKLPSDKPSDEHAMISANDVRQALENPFFGVYQAVRAQLLRTEGVPGWDDDQMSPIIWEHEAVGHQRKLYEEDGPEAWDKAYAEIR